MFLTEVEVLMG